MFADPVQVISNKWNISRLTVTFLLISCVVAAGLLLYAATTSDDEDISVWATDDSDSLQLRGSVYAKCTSPGSDSVNTVIFSVAVPADADPVNFTNYPDNVVAISYVDEYQRIEDLPWKSEEYIPGDGDPMLEIGETFLITADLGNVRNPSLLAGTSFSIEVKTPDGEVLTIKRTTPDQLSPVVNLF